MTERIKFEVDDAELEAVIARIDEAILKKAELFGVEIPERLGEDVTAAADMVEAEVEATIERLTAELLVTEEIAAAVEASVESTVARLTAEMLAVEVKAEVVRDSLQDIFMGMPLPEFDRATRMILYRIPGLREVLRLIYIIKMEQRTLALSAMRGPLTALVTLTIYFAWFMQNQQRRQDRLEARVWQLEREMDRRLVTMEEALHGYGELPQRFRSTVPP